MGLVRNSHSAAYLRDAVVLDLGEIAAQGHALRERAQAEAERIVGEAKHKVEQLMAVQREEGYRAGYESGHKDGFGKGVEEGRNHAMAQAASDIETSLQGWNDALGHFLSVREQLQQEARHDVLRLALDMGKRITYRLAEQDSTIIESQLEETLHLLVTKTKVIIAVNPNDLETAQMIMPSLLERMEQCHDAVITADSTIHPGGCFVHTESGDIDARIDTQIRRIVETLLPRGGERGDTEADHDELNGGVAGNDAVNVGESVDGGASITGGSEETSSGVGNHLWGENHGEAGDAGAMLVDSFLSDDSEAVPGDGRLDGDIENEGSDGNRRADGGGGSENNNENDGSVDEEGAGGDGSSDEDSADEDSAGGGAS